MSENNQNKKNEYEIGYGSDFLNDFPDFDSLEKAPIKQDKQPDSVPDKPSQTVDAEAEDNIPDESISETVNHTHSISKTPKKAAFIAICAVLVVAIIGSSVISAFSINKFLNSSSEAPEVSDSNSQNEYTKMVAKYDTSKYPAGIIQSLTKAYAANNDVVGWLYIAGTNINTSVVQGSNNNYYLRNNFYGLNTNYGTTYADYRCQKNTLSKNTVIYGHNMPSGTHFYDVNRYEDIEWYKQNPVITYSTLYGTYTFLIYTAFYTTVDSKDDGGYVFNYIYPNMSESNFKGYLEQVNQRALYTTGVDLKTSDKIITLSTCNHTYDKLCGQDVDSRLVVIGRLLRSGESGEVNTSSAKENTNYRRPQIWYDKKGKTNPYSNSRSWSPSSN
jgi:SrtB family sortase